MEKKTKHRILGVCVVLGVIVISLPFFQSNADLPTQTTSVQAPPFPGQSMQVAAIDPSQTQGEQPDDTIPAAKTPTPNIVPIAAPTSHVDAPAPIAPVAQATPPSHPAVTPATPATVTEDKVLASEENTTNASESEEVNQYDASSAQPKLVKNTSLKPLPKKPSVMSVADKVEMIPHESIHAHAKRDNANTAGNENGLFSLKHAAWVIQLGSFKNKAYALRLVNDLRAQGYPAFMQKTTTVLGDSTRVFVGPENKRSLANAMAEKLATNMHLQGIVISYKPLSL